jgi:hypothetical protein
MELAKSGDEFLILRVAGHDVIEAQWRLMERRKELKMKTLRYALVGALMFPAAGAIAQQFDAPQMLAGLTMLQTNASNAFKAYNIEADPAELSLVQLAEIIGVLNDPERDSGGRNVKQILEAILEPDIGN